MSKPLPRVNESNLSVLDKSKRKCCGYLNKKASQSSAFSKGKWQKRWFSIDIDIDNDQNYHLEYFHTPDEKVPRSSMPLAGANVKIAGVVNFALTLADGNSISLNAESSEQLQAWISTLESIIAVSNAREKIFSQYETHSDGSADSKKRDERKEDNKEKNSWAASFFARKKPAKNSEEGHNEHDENDEADEVRTKVHVLPAQRGWPTVRIDYDISQIPPGSQERYQFVQLLRTEVANALQLDHSMIEIMEIKASPGMSWLIIVEFDFHILLYEEEYEEYEDQPELLNQHREEIRQQYLQLFYDMIVDQNSVLYKGYLTSKIDPEYCLHFFRTKKASEEDEENEDEEGKDGENPKDRNRLYHSAPMEDVEYYSASPEIMKLMLHYKDTAIPKGYLPPKDITENWTHFEIYVEYDGHVGKLYVPNSTVLTKRYCFLWPYEIKQALGFMNTMQELFIEPIELMLQDPTNKADSAPIPFAPSIRLHNQDENSFVIHTALLKPGATYEVKCEDTREEALNSLEKDEMDRIKETFQQFDLNADGGISKYEMNEVLKVRLQTKITTIEEQYQNYLKQDTTLSYNEIKVAEQYKNEYIQQLEEAQSKLKKILEASDIDGNGSISFTEFMLAEAWWLRCTINPDRAHLF